MKCRPEAKWFCFGFVTGARLHTWRSVLKGHDFSRAAKRSKIKSALAPEGRLSNEMDFFIKLFSPGHFVLCNKGTTLVGPQNAAESCRALALLRSSR